MTGSRALLDQVGEEEGEPVVLLVHGEALLACGDYAGAAQALPVARHRLLARAARITDPACHARFLERAADDAHTLELTRRWLDEAAE